MNPPLCRGRNGIGRRASFLIAPFFAITMLMASDPGPVPLTIVNAGLNGGGKRIYRLSWDAVAAATYRVQERPTAP